MKKSEFFENEKCDYEIKVALVINYLHPVTRFLKINCPNIDKLRYHYGNIYEQKFDKIDPIKINVTKIKYILLDTNFKMKYLSQLNHVVRSRLNSHFK